MVIGKLRTVFGVSTGWSGQYGVGDIVVSDIERLSRGEWDGVEVWMFHYEPCHNVFVINMTEWGESIHYITEQDLTDTREYYEKGGK